MNALDRKLVEMGLLEAEPGWFEVFVTHLQEYKTEHGHCRVPSKSEYPKDYKIGQRVDALRSGDAKVTLNQRANLDALGFIWDATRIWFPEFLGHLRSFHAEHGHCHVPQFQEYPKGYKLGRRLGYIRQGRYKLSSGQGAELDALGFRWDPQNWYTDFIQHLRAYQTEYGHCKVSKSLEYPKGYKLGSRVACIRNGYQKVTDKQRTELDDLGFVWEVRNWYPEFIVHLGTFKQEQGHCQVHWTHVCFDCYKLGQQVRLVRAHKLPLTTEQRAELDALGFVWVNKRRWYTEFIKHLKAFKMEHGHCRVPVTHEYPKGYKLGMKVSGIRSRNSQVTEEQRAELDALGFLWHAGAWAGQKGHLK